MANKHTKAQRAWVIERLAYGFPVAMICERFAIRYPDTRCVVADVHSCDYSIVTLSPEEFGIHAKAVQFAIENPEAIAPALDPKRRQMHTIIAAEQERDRGAFDLMAKLYRQVDEAQGLIGAGAKAKTAAADAKGEKYGDASITWKIIDPVGDA